LGDRVRVSWLEFDVLWEHFGLGPCPPVLAVPSPGRTEGERAALRARAWASLGERGADHEWLERRLAALARPEWEIDVRMPPGAALIGRLGRHATVAVRRAGELLLSVVPGAQITTAAVRLLPAHPGGTGASVRVPASVVDRAAARGDPDRFREVLAAGVGSSAARRVTDVLANVTRYAHVGAARTPPGGERRRAGHVVSVYDAPHGRYLFTRKEEWVTLVPGTESAVTRQIDELLARL
jgi:hypothetical protein